MRLSGMAAKLESIESELFAGVFCVYGNRHQRQAEPRDTANIIYTPSSFFLRMFEIDSARGVLAPRSPLQV